MKKQSLEAHLESRAYNNELYHNTVMLDEETDTVSFLLYTVGTHKVFGFHQYKPYAPKKDKSLKPAELKYFTYNGTKSTYGYWGYEFPMFDTTHWDGEFADGIPMSMFRNVIFLAEGVFDVMPFHALGLHARAMLCNNPMPLKNMFAIETTKMFVPVLDGDDAGRKLMKYASPHLSCIQMPEGMDSGDFAQRLPELKQLVTNWALENFNLKGKQHD